MALVLTTAVPVLEISDIQAIVVRPRPSPYRGEYVIIRVDDAAQGREVVRRMIAHVAKADATIDMHAFTSGYSLKSSSGFARQNSVPWLRFSSDAWGRSMRTSFRHQPEAQPLILPTN